MSRECDLYQETQECYDGNFYLYDIQLNNIGMICDNKNIRPWPLMSPGNS